MQHQSVAGLRCRVKAFPALSVTAVVARECVRAQDVSGREHGKGLVAEEHAELALALLGLLGGVILGFAARAAHFCTLGAIEEAYYGSERSRLRTWLLAMGTAVAATQLLDLLGIVDLSASYRLGSQIPWFGAILGGLLFGFGMALVGTCAFGMLVRLGGGDLRALVATLVVGIAGYMAMSGVLARLRLEYVDSVRIELPPLSSSALPALLFGADPVTGQILVSVIFVALTAGWALSRPRFRQRPGLVAAGLAIGLVIAGGWAVTSQWGQLQLYPHQPDSYSFVKPIGAALLWLMTTSGTYESFTIGGIFGVPLGALMAACLKGEVHWEAFDDPREMRRHLIGAAFMGLGGIMAGGCTIGQGMTGMAALSVTAFLALGGIVAGALVGIRWLVEGNWPDPCAMARHIRNLFPPRS